VELVSPNGAQPLRHAIFSEIAEYKGISITAVERRAEAALEDYTREWQAFLARGQALPQFYTFQEAEIYLLAAWHAELGAVQARVNAVQHALDHDAQAVLDFRSGIGSDAIVFAQLGFTVTLADVSSSMLQFAKWRLERRALKASYLDLNRCSLPSSSFDVAVSFDVFEHIPSRSVCRELRRIQESLTADGVLFMTIPDALHEPSHVTSPEQVLRNMRFAGFEWCKCVEGYAGKKATRSAPLRCLVRCWDFVKFSFPIAKRMLRTRLDGSGRGAELLRVYRKIRSAWK